jgi:uroporphyrinogen-III decarboxylase
MIQNIRHGCYPSAMLDILRNPYMVNAGCEIPSGTPAENLKALCEPVLYRSS